MSVSVDSTRVSKVVGYSILKGNFSNTTPNLPQRIAIIGEANTANQASLSAYWDIATEITTAKQAGDLFGYGSPIYNVVRILRPLNGGGVGGIPIVVYPQAAAAGQQKIWEIVPSGTATGNAIHTVIINGRRSLDGGSYDISISTGDTVATICGKINTAINNVLGCPVTSSNFAYEVDLYSKWTGATADGITVSVDTNNNAVGMTYACTSMQSGTGTPSITTALTNFGNDWNTIVINTYGTNTTVLASLESANGIPDPTNPTGRYVGTLMKPFIALTGSVADNDSTLTDSHLNDVTIAICPAPLSQGLPMEAAANFGVLFAKQAQDAPQLDISGSFLPDMPTPTTIGTMMTYDYRDQYVKKGNSTVDLVAGKYKVMDFVTTYHPTGETPPQFRYCRNLNIDWNVRFTYYLLEQINVVDHAIASDDDVVTASSVIKPKQWIAILYKMAEDLTKRSLITDAPFTQESITVDLSTTNPDRLETFFRYKRTGYTRILATEAEAGFNFGQ